MIVEYRIVLVNEVKIQLNKKEFDILQMLMANPGRVYTHEQIVEQVWNGDYVGNSQKILWPHITRIKNKLQINPELPEFIKTVHGVGYKFESKKTKS